MYLCTYMCVCVCVCIYIYMCIYIYIYKPSADFMWYRSADLNLLVLVAHPAYWNRKK